MENNYKNYIYILITPARNEEKYIEKTIQSVISQTILPKKWVIVSDGSTDRTDEIVRKYTNEHRWIELVCMPEHKDRHFASKIHSFNAGYKRIKDSEYDILGNLDADITFKKDYFEYLLGKFFKNPKLGVAGTPFVDRMYGTYDYRFTDIGHVSGACQLFRRECFKEIGGFMPNKEGGSDWIAVTTARMKGWETRSFSDRIYIHHRAMGKKHGSKLLSQFNYGKQDYFLGGHPLWEFFRAIYQMTKKPYIVGGLCLFFGYFWAWSTRAKRPISRELIKFHRQEQMQRLKQLIGSNRIREEQ